MDETSPETILQLHERIRLLLIKAEEDIERCKVKLKEYRQILQMMDEKEIMSLNSSSSYSPYSSYSSGESQLEEKECPLISFDTPSDSS